MNQKGSAELCQDAMRAPTHDFEVKGKKNGDWSDSNMAVFKVIL